MEDALTMKRPRRAPLASRPLPGLSAYLRHEIEARGWNEAMLADKSGLSRPTLNNLIRHPHIVPTLETLAALSGGLDVPLAALIELCGFTVTTDDVAPATRVSRMVRRLPRLAAIVDKLTQLPDADLRAIEGYLMGWDQSRRKE